MMDLLPHLSNKQLKFGYWLLENKVKIRSIFLLAVYAFLASFYIFSGYQLYRYISSGPAYEKMLSDLSRTVINYQNVRLLNTPRPLVIEKVEVVEDGSSKVDVVVKVHNNNGRWWLKELDYYFQIGSQKSETRSVSILPGETKYLYVFSLDGFSRGNLPQLVMKRKFWRKVSDSSQLTPSYTWKQPEFEVDNLSYQPRGQEGFYSSVSFDLTNYSQFNFWNVEVQVALRLGQQLVAFNVLQIDDFESGETKPLQVLWNQSLSATPSTEVIISANPLEKSNLRNYYGGFTDFSAADN